jgi:hypothetical protein
MKEPRVGEVYEGPEGPMIYVREESGQFVFAAARDRVIFTRKFDEVPEKFELVYDFSLAAERDDLAKERAALVAALKIATGKLDEESAGEVRAEYRQRMEAGTE